MSIYNILYFINSMIIGHILLYFIKIIKTNIPFQIYKNNDNNKFCL